MHSKYRKLLDPLFAPKRMDEQEADITRRVNRFVDVFIDRGECNFTEEFAELFPSSVFLGLMGLPEGPRKRCACSCTCATASCTHRSGMGTRSSTLKRARQ
jgi:cytochrome P450